MHVSCNYFVFSDYHNFLLFFEEFSQNDENFATVLVCSGAEK